MFMDAKMLHGVIYCLWCTAVTLFSDKVLFGAEMIT